MADYWIYSEEALPNPALMGKKGYTPDADYIKTGGVTLPCLPAKTWLHLEEGDDRYNNFYRWNWTQKKGNVDIAAVPLRRFMPVVNNRFAERGVVMLDHKPSDQEKATLEATCAENNWTFRKRAVEFFEAERDSAKARQGRYEPTAYIDECYDVLGMKKPYSMEAMKAQRDPGKEAADKIAEAIAGALKRDREDAAMQLAEVLTKPEPEKVPAARR